jgi:hypothetical protein
LKGESKKQSRIRDYNTAASAVAYRNDKNIVEELRKVLATFQYTVMF